MPKLQKLILISILLFLIHNPIIAQSKNKLELIGQVVTKSNKQPLEYATIIIKPINSKLLTGGLTNKKGNFKISVKPGIYNISIEFMSFKKYTIKNKKITSNTNLGTILLTPNIQNLDEVEIIAEKSTVELKLDKKIYNVGKDMTVRGGTASDVLDNVPSVSVDVEGNISLRSNDNVRILVNGKPSGLIGLNNTDALRQLPADAIQKVEVITSPSARYDAEGSAGIINIILRKGKALGFNGSVQANAGNPDLVGISANLNYRTKKFNFFTNTGYNYRTTLGNSSLYEENFINFGDQHFLKEKRTFNRKSNNFNTNIGFDYYINPKNSITISFLDRNSDRNNLTKNNSDNFSINNTLTKTFHRTEVGKNKDNTTEFSFNYTKKFKEDGHQLTIDFKQGKTNENGHSEINEFLVFPTNLLTDQERIVSNNNQKSTLLQSDYVLPIGDNSQFEIGYKGSIKNLITNYEVDSINAGNYVIDANFSNILEYNENIQAAYTQFGSKIKKFSFLLGIRVENSNIDIRLKTTNENFDKNYTQFFPTLNLGYELSDNQSITIGINRRIRRPRSRFINPFPTRSSATNLFSGNADLNPSYTNGFEIGYLKRSKKLTLNTSIYYQHSTGVFQFISQETGEFTKDSIPILLRKPINLSTQDRFGFEFTTMLNAFDWWQLSSNFNFYKSITKGSYKNINFDADNFSWFARFNSKIKLPQKIDFQTRVIYRGPRKTAQSKRRGLVMLNLAFSKDILKKKGTLAFNISDLLNTRKRNSTDYTTNTITQSTFQWRQRTITLSFTYRFNQKKKRAKRNRNFNNSGNEEFGG